MNWFQKTVLSRRFWLGAPKFSPQPSKLSVTIVIPAWNEEDYIAATIESVLAQDYPLEIIVVNDRSTDRTSEIAKRYGNLGVRVIDVEEKAGSKSQALNKAIPYVSTDIFICVDADTELDTDSVSKLMRAFNNPNVAVACGFVVSKNDHNFWQCARRGEYIVGQSILKSAQENMNAVLVASGCFFAIRFDLLKRHGFDDRTLAEDMDLTWCAVEDGYDVAFVQDAYCYVNDPDSWYLYHKQVYRWYAGLFQCIKERKFNLFNKNPKLGIAVYFYALNSLLDLPIMMISIIAGMIAMPGATMILMTLIYLILFVPAALHGMIRREDTRRYPYYIFTMILVSFLSYCIFVKACYTELFTKNTLRTWVKGH